MNISISLQFTGTLAKMGPTDTNIYQNEPNWYDTGRNKLSLQYSNTLVPFTY